ncbi:MAG: hypothetical protein U0802_10835 [Candidatus Binatia bacterium]
MPVDARAEYTVRLSQRRRRAAALALAERRIGTARLVCFVAALALAWAAFALPVVPGWTAALPAVAFAALLLRHARVIPARRAADRAVACYERGLARLDDAWAGGGIGGERYLDLSHPYAADLDLFGRGSLFELLCTARTRAGQDCLAAWLLAPAPPDDVRARQAAVVALRSRLDLREDLAVLGDAVGDALHAEALAAWGTAPRRLAGAPCGAWSAWSPPPSSRPPPRGRAARAGRCRCWRRSARPPRAARRCARRCAPWCATSSAPAATSACWRRCWRASSASRPGRRAWRACAPRSTPTGSRRRGGSPSSSGW